MVAALSRRVDDVSVRARVFVNGRIEAGEEVSDGLMGERMKYIYMGAISHDSRPVAFPKQISNSDQRALGGRVCVLWGPLSLKDGLQGREKGVASLVCTH